MTGSTATKVGLDVAAGVGLAEVNGLDTNTTVILNGLIVLARIVAEIIQHRRERKRRKKSEE